MSEGEDDLRSLINIISCNLQVVNGGFEIGAKSANWKLKKILKGCFTIFYNTPARRDDYIGVTGSTRFSLFFFSTRCAFLISWVIFVTCLILCDIAGGRVTKGNGLQQMQFSWFISKLPCDEYHEFNKFIYFLMI